MIVMVSQAISAPGWYTRNTRSNSIHGSDAMERSWSYLVSIIVTCFTACLFVCLFVCLLQTKEVLSKQVLSVDGELTSCKASLEATVKETESLSRQLGEKMDAIATITEERYGMLDILWLALIDGWKKIQAGFSVSHAPILLKSFRYCLLCLTFDQIVLGFRSEAITTRPGGRKSG